MVLWFREGRSNIHNGERRDRTSVRINDLAELVNVKVNENRCFTISEFAVQFPEVSRAIFFYREQDQFFPHIVIGYES